MTNNNFITGVATLLLGFMFSCDNTSSESINDTLNNPNSPGNTSTITGPRILQKIVVNNVTDHEFVTTGNVLEKVIFKEVGDSSFLHVATITYTSGKITRVKFEQEFIGTAPADISMFDYNITYDSDGKINYTTCNMILGIMQNFTSEYTYTYDSSGKMTKIAEKRRKDSNYVEFVNYNFTNTGDNITKIIRESGITNAAGIPDLSATVSTTTYNYTAYDSKINPYTTLPKTFFVMWGLLKPGTFYLLSANNVMSFNIAFPPFAPSSPGQLLTGNYTYLYDSMNYPTSNQTQTQKYVYKAL